MFYKIIAHTPNKTQWKETITIIHNLEKSGNLVKAIAEDLMFELLEEQPIDEFYWWENHPGEWYAACHYDYYEVDLDLEDCELYDITEEEWREETGIYDERAKGRYEEDAAAFGLYERF